MAAKMCYALRKVELLATPVSAPAVPFWESRVRICLSADDDNDAVNGLVAAIVKAGQNIGLIDNRSFQPKLFDCIDEPPTRQETLEAREVAKQIRELIHQDMAGIRTSNSNRDILCAVTKPVINMVLVPGVLGGSPALQNCTYKLKSLLRH